MFINEEDLAAAASADWDVMVVGAGAVGLVLAVSLSRANKKVLLLESGAADHTDANDLNYVQMTGRPHLGALSGRARTVGGTTTLWGGQLTQFSSYDFDARDIMADCPWPLQYTDIERHYADVAAMLDLDLSHLSDESIPVRSMQNSTVRPSGCEIFFTRWLREPNLARFFAADLAARSTLSVASRCHATALLCGSDEGKITGIRAVAAGGREFVFRARDVVLACGTIEISRLLLLTAKKSPNLAWAQNANIGRYFQDHLDLVIGRIELKDKRAFADIFENALIGGYKYQPKIRMKTAELRKLGCLNIACTVRFDSAIAEDIHMLKQFLKSLLRGSRVDKPWRSIRRMAALGPVWFPLIWRYLRHRRILALSDRGISVIAHCEQRPLRESRISLDSGKIDRFGDPIARLHWLVDEALQLKSLQLFADQLTGFLDGQCHAMFAARAAILAGDASIMAEATDSYHQCGGARMALQAADGVVDADCKVFGTRNLFVAGAAVFPSSSFANPTFTAMAIAYRLRNHLLEVRQ